MDKEKKEDDTVVVGFGCRFLDKPIPGSLIKNCDECGIEIWISPTWIRKKVDKYLCLDCSETLIERLSKDVIDKKDNDKDKENESRYVITLEQIEEFNVYYKKKYGKTMSNEDILKVLEIELGKKVVIKNM